MAKLYNLARMTTATAGTGTITLGAAVSGYLTFAGAGVANGDVVSYAIKDGANSEIGTGTYTSSGTTLTRTVTKSTNADAAISLSGTAEVFITPRKEDFAGAASFGAHKNSVDQTGVADVTFTAVTFGTEAFDIGSNFASNAWTPPAGVVFVVVQLLLSGTWAAGATLAVRILKSGTSIAQGNWNSAGANSGSVFAAIIETANGTDTFTVEVYADVTSGTATVTGAPVNTYFRGVWLGP